MATAIQLLRLLAGLLALLLISSAVCVSGDFEGFDPEEFAGDDSNELAGDYFIDAASSPPISHSSPQSSPAPVSTPNPSPNLNPVLEFWDEDEFEGLPISTPPPPPPPEEQPAVDEEAPVEEMTDSEVAAATPSPAALATTVIQRFYVEILCVIFLICFAVNYFVGKRQNEDIALAWIRRFATKDSIFDKNFSLLGTGDGKDTPLLLREGQDVFKFYASGRRFCQGMLATLELRSRHDLISRAVGLIFPRRDTISLEVVMNDDGMDHVVVAMARKKAAKAMLKEEKDLARFAAAIGSPGTGRQWVSEELTVLAESKEVASDMITEAVIDQVFGEKAFDKFGKWFISLHLSDQRPGSCKKALVFKFVLPDINSMAEMTRLIALVPYYIDLVGRYKLSSHARSKTEATRAKAAQEEYKELQNSRQEALQRKKAEKKKLLEESEAKLSAEAMRKKEEKDRARQLKKAMPRVRMLR